MTSTLQSAALKMASPLLLALDVWERRHIAEGLVRCPNEWCSNGQDDGNTCRTCDGKGECAECVGCGGAVSEEVWGSHRSECFDCWQPEEVEAFGGGAFEMGGEA